ncbi:MAG: prefoldin subunit alpha [Nanoarchaeota archaeon]|nr:prefoldin subunit alpha [Nanoarchaeota archaeon]
MEDAQQQKYLEYQMLNNQLRQLAQEIQGLEQQAKELEMLIEGVEEVGKAEKGTDILSSIGGGLYVKTKLENNNEFLINSGARVISTKTKDEAKALLEEQLNELRKVAANMQAELQNGIQRIVMLESELRKAQKK